MKNEPLKNKTLIIKEKNTPIAWEHNKQEDIIFSRTRIYLQDDVKSAVEWFIQEMKRLNKETTTNINISNVIGVIKEAFSDLYIPKEGLK